VANLAQHLLDTAAQHGDRPALRMDDAVLTYDGFREAAASVAASALASSATTSRAPESRR
jgi:long-chain acyl-CoA synthetase